MRLAFTENCGTVYDADQATCNIKARPWRGESDIQGAGNEKHAAYDVCVRQAFINRAGYPHGFAHWGSVHPAATMPDIRIQNSASNHSSFKVKVERPVICDLDHICRPTQPAVIATLFPVMIADEFTEQLKFFGPCAALSPYESDCAKTLVIE